MSKRIYLIAIPLIATLSILPASRLQAYILSVHLDVTTDIVEHWGADLDEEEKLLIAFCSQLPDEASDYSATSLYLRVVTRGNTFLFTWLNWALRDNVDDEETRRMITVQQLLHGLTGGNSEALTQTAQIIVRRLVESLSDVDPARRGETLCAIGFAIHLLGDSYAHRLLDRDATTYSTGSGHARHGTIPDHVFRDGEGLGHLRNYMQALSDLQAATRAGGARAYEDVYEKVCSVAPECTSKFSREQELEARLVLDSRQLWSPLEDLAPRPHDPEPCQHYIDDLLQKSEARLFERWREPGLQCKAVWKTYRFVAEEEFRNAGMCTENGFRSPETLSVGCEDDKKFVDPEPDVVESAE